MGKVYYKVVRDRFFGVFSCNMEHHELIVEYKLNEWVRPRIDGTKLMVFESLSTAKEHAVDRPIYECQIKNPSRTGFFCYNAWNWFSSIPDLYFKKLELKRRKKKYLYELDRKSIPKGTVFCDAVMLTRRIT